MLILTSVFVLRQQRFQSSTLLRSLAYSVALSVRQAQVYGTSIRESSIGAFDANTAAKAYGVYLSSGSTGSYILFADTYPSGNPDGQYTAGQDVVVNNFSLSNGYTLNKFCVTNTSNTQICSPTITNMTIMFKRPNPYACFTSSAAPGACATGAMAVYKNAYVQVKSNADIRTVKVTLTGQITVCSQNVDVNSC